MERQRRFPDSWTYFLLCALLWVIVDWGTAGGFRPAYFEKFGFSLLVFYIGYPAVFSILIFIFHWGEGLLFAATLAAIFIIEVVFTGNPLLTSFPRLLFGIPLSIMVYAPLTFFPLWIVRGQVGRRKRIMLFLAGVEMTVMMLTVLGAQA
ncbi:MAG: hypothetical protein WBM17_01135 [Anaerolineales bacterium]